MIAPSRQVNRGLSLGAHPLVPPSDAVRRDRALSGVADLVALLSYQAAHVVRGDLPFRFFSQPEQGSITGNIVMADGATRDDTLAAARSAARDQGAGARLTEQDGTNPVTFAMIEVGGQSGPPLPCCRKQGWRFAWVHLDRVGGSGFPHPVVLCLCICRARRNGAEPDGRRNQLPLVRDGSGWRGFAVGRSGGGRCGDAESCRRMPCAWPLPPSQR
jgi:hypothetical protein